MQEPEPAPEPEPEPAALVPEYFRVYGAGVGNVTAGVRQHFAIEVVDDNRTRVGPEAAVVAADFTVR